MNHSHTFYHPQFTGDELVFVAFVVLMIEKSRSFYVERLCRQKRKKSLVKALIIKNTKSLCHVIIYCYLCTRF